MNDQLKMTQREDYWRESPHSRYRRDVLFAAVVDMLYAHINQGNYTPTELREACHLAACMYEERTIRPMLIDPKEPFKWNVVERKPSEGSASQGSVSREKE
jgi:hypothetical protein